ncbi:Ferric anguibactin-binding protein [Marinomonas ushuaiensis DSM 15871]|uniref:Ferric anguibactin-binding protein n=1 Tax=Marinomonas ushuaiensis DSM 15871 TaxID=1122207 RepID=X7E2M1_9GAMM|nr:ABC transporter substrate-binding protein [Marinomonas ushuaiensis]ETX09376.1 Ferric anguibactin-binding protein [Marinomonas ushuaiensis DSM 15871]
MLSINLKTLLVGFTLMAISTTSAFAKTYQHSLGTIDIDGVPQRVVVLGFGSLDFVDALGVEPIAVPKSLLPESLSKYKADKFANTGSLKEVNYETLFTLKPDLIIAEARMAELYKDLSDIAPVYMYRIDSENYWETTKNHWNNLSEIFNKQEKGKELVHNIQSKIDALNAKSTAKPLKALTVMSNGGNVTSFGPISRFSFVYQEAGFEVSKSVDVEVESRAHGDLISFEYIADAKPDVLLVLDRDQAIGKANGKAKELFSNDLVESTPAAKNKRITYLEPVAWYLSSGGYHSTNLMIDDLSNAID